MVNPDYHKWLCKLLGYDFDIEYKPGFTNKAVDALSQVLAQFSLLNLFVPCALQMTELDKELATDPTLSQLQQSIAQQQNTKLSYSIHPRSFVLP